MGKVTSLQRYCGCIIYNYPHFTLRADENYSSCNCLALNSFRDWGLYSSILGEEARDLGVGGLDSWVSVRSWDLELPWILGEESLGV